MSSRADAFSAWRSPSCHPGDCFSDEAASHDNLRVSSILNSASPRGGVTTKKHNVAPTVSFRPQGEMANALALAKEFALQTPLYSRVQDSSRRCSAETFLRKGFLNFSTKSSLVVGASSNCSRLILRDHIIVRVDVDIGFQAVPGSGFVHAGAFVAAGFSVEGGFEGGLVAFECHGEPCGDWGIGGDGCPDG